MHCTDGARTARLGHNDALTDDGMRCHRSLLLPQRSICLTHMRANEVDVDGHKMRFCQKCAPRCSALPPRRKTAACSAYVALPQHVA
jgi:hypothetical protein